MNTILDIFRELNSYSTVAPYIFGLYCVILTAWCLAVLRLFYLLGRNLIKGYKIKYPIWFYTW